MTIVSHSYAGCDRLQGVEPWTIGVIVVLALGLAAIVYGAVSDRAKTNRARREILSPPDRQIPRFSPETPAPRYLSELQARRPPQDTEPSVLTDTERADLHAALRRPATAKVSLRPPSKVFVTDQQSGWSVLRHPAVLVCGEPVASFRELLPVAERHVLSGAPLVVVAPAFTHEALSTLEVNYIQQKLRVLPVTSSDRGQLRTVAVLTGAQVVGRADLQAGYVPTDHFGSCAVWVSDSHHSWLLMDEEVGG